MGAEGLSLTCQRIFWAKSRDQNIVASSNRSDSEYRTARDLSQHCNPVFPLPTYYQPQFCLEKFQAPVYLYEEYVTHFYYQVRNQWPTGQNYNCICQWATYEKLSRRNTITHAKQYFFNVCSRLLTLKLFVLAKD